MLLAKFLPALFEFSSEMLFLDGIRREEMVSLIEQRLALLISLDPAAIRSISDSSDDVVFDGLPAKLHVYHERIEGNHHRVIVQAFRPSASGISALVIPHGFLLGGGDHIRDLRDNETYDYT